MSLSWSGRIWYTWKKKTSLLLASLAREFTRMFLELGKWDMLKPKKPSHIKWNETSSEANIGQLIGLAIMSIKPEQSVLTCIIVTCNSHKQVISYRRPSISVCKTERLLRQSWRPSLSTLMWYMCVHSSPLTLPWSTQDVSIWQVEV